MSGVGVTPESGAHSVPFHESSVKQEKKEMLIKRIRPESANLTEAGCRSSPQEPLDSFD
jgi:hypothetical protein